MQSVTLIIDKRKELSTKYKKLLERTSRVVVIDDLLFAMKIIKEDEPDLIIISDSVSHDLSEDCKKIRALTYNTRPIIVGLSKSSELDDKLKTLENGADDFISEPVNSEEFVMRMKAHLRREYESNLDFKKFLPNKNYSMRALKRVVGQNTSWACLLISIENFQNYKETYTELASDKLIQTFLAIIRSVLDENDYLGGISENEFLIITDQYKAEKVANFLTFAFDSVASKFYTPQDNERGFMLMQGDEIAGQRSNFAHITIGIVNNEFIHHNDPTHLMNTLIQIHNLAKHPAKSTYLMERPMISGEDSVLNEEINRKISIVENDESLALLLKTILELQGYEILDEKNNVAVTPAIIIIDAGEAGSLIGLEICKQIRAQEKFNRTKIIVTSNIHDKELILKCGADLYLPKPYEPLNLVKWVDKLFL